MQNDFIDVYNNGGTNYTFATAIYVNDNGTTSSEINSYTISGNILNEGIIVANGVGDPTGHTVGANELITNNAFTGAFNPNSGVGRYDTVVLNGQVAGIAWLLAPTQVPTISGNTFSDNLTPFLLRGSDDNAANLPTAAQISQILSTNGDANLTYAYVVDTATGGLVTATRDDGSGPFHSLAVTNTIDTLNLALDSTADNVFGSTPRDYIHAGNTIVVQSGANSTVNSQLMVENLTVKATVNSADLNLTLATQFADGTPIASGGVHNVTLANYAAGQGANVDVTGNGLANIIIGNSGANFILGGGGADTFTGGGGNDTIDGGSEADTVIFSGSRASYNITLLNNGDISVIDVRGGSPDGSDTVRHVENFQFADGTLTAAAVVQDVPPGAGGTGASGVTRLYNENALPVVIDPAFTVSDPDSATLVGATAAISAHFHAGEDVLGFTNQNGISGSYNSATGVLTLTGTATLANYQTALASVTFFDSSDIPSGDLRTIHYTANDGIAVGSLGDDFVQVVPITYHPVSDLNEDGHSDILWRHSGGQTVIWEMNGGTKIADLNLNSISLDWSIQDTGDFNGDGKADILWRNTNGTTVLWEMNGGTKILDVNLNAISTDWSVQGTGDFNGDGHSDIVWRNTGGQTVLWEMNGGTKLLDVNLNTITTDWKIQGFGDFNGDGKSDIVWRNNNGTTVLWEMDGGNKVLDVNLNSIPTDWHIQGIGDFNNDGHSDILWRNNAGSTVLWEMNGGTRIADLNLGTMTSDWKIQTVGDYNGDHMSDIVWRNDNGAATVWEMNGGTRIADVALSPIGTDWTLQHHHFDIV